MTLYAGQVSHKASSKSEYKTGELREVVGATDSRLLAEVFGVDPAGLGKRSSNGKFRVAELINPGRDMIYIDEDEMQTVDEWQFVNQHLNAIVNYQKFSDYVALTQPQKVTKALADLEMNGVSFRTLSNETRTLISQFIVGRATKQDVLESTGEANKKQQILDVIHRAVFSVKSEKREFEFGGVTGTIYVNAMEREAKDDTPEKKMNVSSKRISVPYEVSVIVDGTTSGFTSKSVKPYAQYFSKLKKKITSVCYDLGGYISHNYNTTGILDNLFDEIQGNVKVDKITLVNKAINNINAISAEDLGVEEIEDYNPIKAWQTLKVKLGLNRGFAFAITNFDDKDAVLEQLKQIDSGELSANEFMQLQPTYFISRFRKSLLDRFLEGNVAYDAYLQRALDNIPEVRMPEELKNDCEKIAEETVSDYSAVLQTNDDVIDLWHLFHMTNMEHDNQILSILQKRLIEFLSSAKEDNPLLELIKPYATERLRIFVNNVYDSLVDEQNVHDEKLVDDFLESQGESELSDVLTVLPDKINEDNYKDIVRTIVNGLDKQHIKAWMLNRVNFAEIDVNVEDAKEELYNLYQEEAEKGLGKEEYFDLYKVAEHFDYNADDLYNEVSDDYNTLANEMVEIGWDDEVITLIEGQADSLNKAIKGSTSIDDLEEKLLLLARKLFRENNERLIEKTIQKYESRIVALFENATSKNEDNVVNDGEEIAIADKKKFLYNSINLTREQAIQKYGKSIEEIGELLKISTRELEEKGWYEDVYVQSLLSLDLKKVINDLDDEEVEKYVSVDEDGAMIANVDEIEKFLTDLFAEKSQEGIRLVAEKTILFDGVDIISKSQAKEIFEHKLQDWFNEFVGNVEYPFVARWYNGLWIQVALDKFFDMVFEAYEDFIAKVNQIEFVDFLEKEIDPEVIKKDWQEKFDNAIGGLLESAVDTLVDAGIDFEKARTAVYRYIEDALAMEMGNMSVDEFIAKHFPENDPLQGYETL